MKNPVYLLNPEEKYGPKRLKLEFPLLSLNLRNLTYGENQVLL